MGRRPDDPLEQAAKGFPGRRKKRVLAAAEAAAEAIAAAAPDGDALALPAMFQAAPARWRRAIDIWQRQAAVLATIGRAQPHYRGALARYCIWSQIYEYAADQLGRDCPRGNYVITWKMGHGAEKRIEHPALGIMATAEPIIRALDQEFGFTPRADSDLTRVETFNQAQGHLPLRGGGPRAPQPEGAAAAQPVDRGDPMGLMNRSDGPAPIRMN